MWKLEENLLDLWIIDKFNVLPTDEKFLKLDLFQKEFLFYGINLLPDKDNIKMSLALNSRKEDTEKKKPEEFVSKTIINSMRKALKMAKHTDEEINKKIAQMGMIAKKKQLDEITKQLRNI